MEELLLRSHAYALAVHTNDSSMCDYLHFLNEPIILFGEREMERRDRLIALMAKLDEERQLEKPMKVRGEEEEEATNVDVEEVQEMEGPQIYPFILKALMDATSSYYNYEIMTPSGNLEVIES